MWMVAGVVVILLVRAERNTVRVNSGVHPNSQVTGKKRSCFDLCQTALTLEDRSMV